MAAECQQKGRSTYAFLQRVFSAQKKPPENGWFLLWMFFLLWFPSFNYKYKIFY